MESDYIKPNHDLYFRDEVVYVNGDGKDETVTSIQRLPMDKPTPSKLVYPSVKKMLESEMERRLPLSNEVRGRFKPKMSHVAYSHIPRADFDGTVKANGEIYKVRNCYFHHSPLNGTSYVGTDGKITTVHHAITTSWDRSSDGLHMSKVFMNPETNESICYGSRPDSPERARKQAEDIFRAELASSQKGLRKIGENEYELTYVVNSLTSPAKLQNPALLNERESLIWEHEALEALGTLIIDGKIVHPKPIHVHHTISVFGELSKILPDFLNGSDLENTINDKGYLQLLEYAQKLPQTPILQDTIYQLYKGLITHTLSHQEELILVDFLSQLCNLPIVHHCKSIVDRTSIASTVALMNHFIKDGEMLTIPRDNEGRFAIHKLLKQEAYRKLFMAFINISHQVSKDARVGITPDKTLVGRNVLALNLRATYLSPSGDLVFFPESALKKTLLTRGLKTRYLALALFYLLLPALLVTYYALLILATIPLAAYFKKKSNNIQATFIGYLFALPLTVKWHKLSSINYDRTFDLKSNDINGDGRHLLCGAKHLRNKEMPDPRLSLIPPSLL